MDLLTGTEEHIDARTRELRFDIPLLARRLTATVDWLGATDETGGLPLATFGASTGAAAALITAADRPDPAAAARLTAEHRIVIIPGATHLFDEPGALDQVIAESTRWLAHWLPAAPGGPAGPPGSGGSGPGTGGSGGTGMRSSGDDPGQDGSAG